MLARPDPGDPKGPPYRLHLQEQLRKARQRSDPKSRRDAQNALRELTNPYRYPDSLKYLHEYVGELFGRSGLSEVGVNPLTWPVVHAWMQATGRELTAMEQRALLEIDAAMNYRGDK